MLGSKFTKFWSFLKQQICFSSKFVSLFSIMIYIYIYTYIYICNIYITPLYFFSWNFIYFQQKELIKVQIWWIFTWTVKSLNFCTLMGYFCKNHIKFQLKRYRRVYLMILKSDAKFKEKLTCHFTFTQTVKSQKISLRWTIFVQSMWGLS